jgi:hypothetical protein
MNAIPDITCSGDSCTLLDVGTKVRVALDEPENLITGKVLHGKFSFAGIQSHGL